jgi:hypothetical protein
VQPLIDWASETGLPKNVISNRLDYGWPVDLALTKAKLIKDPNSPAALRQKLYRERKKLGIKVIKGGCRPEVSG